MNKSKLGIYFDTLTITTIACFIIYIWINKSLKNAFFSFFICIFIYLLLFFVIFMHLNNKHNLTKINILDQKFSNLCLKFFTYSTDEINAMFYSNLLSCTKINNYFFKNNYAYFYINLKTILNENDFHFINNFYQNHMQLPLIIVYKSACDDFLNLILNSPTKYHLKNFNELFSLMKSKNLFPIKKDTAKNKYEKFNKFKTNIIKSLTKNNFAKFLFSGLSLVILSIFIPYSFYYLIFGSILLILSIVCLFAKNKTPNTSNIDLISLTKKDWQIVSLNF